MIINENNKNQISKSMVKRGFNQTPEELKEKLYQQSRKIKENQNPEVKDIQKNVRETFNKMRNLKWLSIKSQLVT